MFLLSYLKFYYDIHAYLTNKKITKMMCKFIYKYKFVNMLMLLPLSLLATAAIQALSLMLNAYLVVETSRINPTSFFESVALSRETCNIGCTRRERVPLGTRSWNSESEIFIKIPDYLNQGWRQCSQWSVSHANNELIHLIQ